MTFFRKKHYREVPCKACDETGKAFYEAVAPVFETCPHCNAMSKQLMETKKERIFAGGCKYCNGKGTQTVLERVE